jgi:peptidoglycan hydrolase-like protein with peptidoglycan-binding domain
VASVAPAAPLPPASIPQAQPAGNQLLAVQRRLSEYGYGPVPLNGVDGPETRAAIERFERSRGLPATGRMSDKLVRELTGMAGKPL